MSTSRATRGYSCAVFCTPASTPLTTPSPTPESAEATASPTPGPTCAFDVMSGDCGATYSCITSPNYKENYAPDGSCVIKLASLTLDVKDFETEVLWDTMVVNCQYYSGSTGPVGVEADVGSLVFQMELAEKRVRLFMPTRQPHIRRRCPAPPVTLSYVVVDSGSLESPNPFYGILRGGEPMYLQHNGATAFVKENGGSLRGWISTDKGWGPRPRDGF